MKTPKRKPPFLGAATALATPFSSNGVDYEALSRMIEYQIVGGIDALVLCGTTGEAATLSDEEYYEIILRGMEMVGGRVPVIIGCGSPNTVCAAKRAMFAAKCGAAATLLVTPYYNKGTKEGIVSHFHTVAEAGGIPLILYHVPARTGVHLSLEDMVRIATHPLIVGIKEASGDMTLFARLAAALGDTLALYSGNDALTLPSLALGGQGVISVISNLLPKEMSDICRLYAEGKTVQACTLHLHLIPLMDLLFRETSPAPIKHTLAFRGLCENILRLPLTRTSEGLSRLLDEEVARLFEKT